MSRNNGRLWVVAVSAAVWFFIACYDIYYAPIKANPNEKSRFYLVHALVSRGEFSIDAEITRFGDTIDKARVGEHYYSDKAPMLAFLSLPFYALYYAVVGDAAGEGDSLRFLKLTLHASAALLLFWLLYLAIRGVCGERSISLFGAAVGIFGTPLSTYFMLYLSHSLAACALFALYIMLRSLTVSPHYGRAVAAGALAGITVMLEYPTFIGVALFSAWLLFCAQRKKDILAYVGGALVPALLFFGYNTVVFGSPLSFGYSNLADTGFAEVHRRGFYGITYPTSDAIVSLLFSLRTGLITLSPFLLFMIPGAYYYLRERRAEGAVLLAVAVSYFIAISSFGVWNGGWSFGARHLVPAMPFMVLLAAVGIQRTVGNNTIVPLIAGSLGAFSMMLFAFVNVLFPYVAEDHRNPFANYFVSVIRERFFLYDSFLTTLGMERPAALAVYLFLAVTGVVILLRFSLVRTVPRLVAVICAATLLLSLLFLPYRGYGPDIIRTKTIFKEHQYGRG
ncbi:MAG TPA: hypothetical protein PLV42_04100 [bacterium]|nr:hypothetical protein [bacterium]